ncbi:MAG: LicD family protein [Bacteroidales bacterium]
MKRTKHKEGFEYYTCLNLQKIQAIQLQMLVFIDEVCRKYNIQYWISGGTLIGAVRHGGYIPWDDDIDISLLYTDYFKLIAALKQECEHHQNYFLAFGNTEELTYYFDKLCSSELSVISMDTGEVSPCAIDLFPIKVIEDSDESKKRDAKLTDTLHYYIHGFFNERHDNLNIETKNLYEALENKKVFIDYFHKFYVDKEKELNNAEIKLLANYNLSPFFLPHKGGYFKFDDIFPLENITFEGIQVLKPKKHDNVLREQYGEYLQLPAVEHRIPTHSSKVVNSSKQQKNDVMGGYIKQLQKKNKIFFYRQKGKISFVLYYILNFGLRATISNFKIVKKIMKLKRKL